MMSMASVRPLGQLSAYGAAMGALIGGGTAALLTVPYLLMYAQFGFVILTIPAFAFGQAVGVLTGVLAPSVALATRAIVRPHTLVGMRLSIAVAVAIFAALPVALLIAKVAVPLSLFQGYPYADLFIIPTSLVVASVAAWRLAPTVGRSPSELTGGRFTRAGWWLIAGGLVPVVPVLAAYGSAWMFLNFDFEPEGAADVAAPLVLLLAVIATATGVLLTIGLALVSRSWRWQHGEFVLLWAIAAACTALFSAIGFWSLVVQSVR